MIEEKKEIGQILARASEVCLSVWPLVHHEACPTLLFVKSSRTSWRHSSKLAQVKDLLEEYSAFQHYRRNDLDLDLRYYFSRDLPQNVQDWAFSLCKANMEAIYNTSWGWSDTDKRQELTAPEARFLVAYDKVFNIGRASLHHSCLS